MATTLQHWAGGAPCQSSSSNFSDVTNPAMGEVTAAWLAPRGGIRRRTDVVGIFLRDCLCAGSPEVTRNLSVRPQGLDPVGGQSLRARRVTSERRAD